MTDEQLKPPVTVFSRNGEKYKHVTVTIMAEGFEFAEGPVWHPAGFLLFSDTPANKIYQVYLDGSVSVYLNESGLSHQQISNLSDQSGSNGLAVDNDGQVLICQHGNHAVASLDNEGQLHNIADVFHGLPFNSPNDIIVHKKGYIYFTDPPYGLKDQVLAPDHFQPVAAVYKIAKGHLQLAAMDLLYPNGLAFSPDQQYLYVSSTFPAEKKVIRYVVWPDGDLVYDGIVINENADGMTTDRQGNIYLATEDGVLIVNSSGEKIAKIKLPIWPSNMAWAGVQEDKLLVTARNTIYCIHFF